jgi:hypothetical protein
MMQMMFDWSRAAKKLKPNLSADRLLNWAIGAMFVLIVLLIHRSAYSHFIRKDAFHLDVASLDTLSQPTWSHGLFDLDEILKERLGEDLYWYSPDVARTMASRIERDPWVRTVNFVERTAPGQVAIEVDFRRPVAAIERDGHYYLTDGEGIRLPGTYGAVPTIGIPVVAVSGGEEAAPNAGFAWESREICEAVSLINVLIESELPRAIAVRSLTVEPYGGADDAGVRMVVYMGEYVPVIWGAGPIDERPWEALYPEKLHNLFAVILRYPGLRQVGRVDLTMDHEGAIVELAEGVNRTIR